MRRLHAFLFVTDMRRSVEFYRRVLRVEPAYRSESWTEFAVGDARLGLHRWEGASAPPSAGVKLFFEVEDLDAERQRLAQEGVRLHGEVRVLPGAGRHLDFEDPDGHILQLWEPEARAHRP